MSKLDSIRKNAFNYMSKLDSIRKNACMFFIDFIFLYIFTLIYIFIFIMKDINLDYFFNFFEDNIINNTILILLIMVLIIVLIIQVVAIVIFSIIRYIINDKILITKKLHYNTTNDNFIDNVKHSLNGDNSLIEIYEILQKCHSDAIWKVHIYKWPCLLILTLIPILSAILSISIASKDTFNFINTAWLSALITLMTILNSIFQPSERFRKACLIGIQLDFHKRTFLEKIEKMNDDKNETQKSKERDKILNEYNNIVSKIQESLIDLFAPEIQGGTKRIKT